MLLYSGPLSLFARKVEIALGEKGLAFERVMVPFTQAAGYRPKHPAVLAANPKGQVPVLEDGGLTLFDSTVILEYLEDAYPVPPLYPQGAAARAAVRLLELTADEILLPPLRSLMYRTEPPSPDAAVQQARDTEGLNGEAQLARGYDALEAKLGEGSWFGAAFGAADIALFMIVYYAQRLRGPGLEGHPRLAAWHGRMLARPAVAKVAAEIRQADRELSYGF